MLGIVVDTSTNGISDQVTRTIVETDQVADSKENIQ